MNKLIKLLITSVCILLVSACTPEVGSPDWCKMMKDKQKGDWTVNESKDYINYCVLKNTKED